MINVGIIGSTGYTGVILVNILKSHKYVDKIYLASKSYTDKKYSDVFPSFETIEDGILLESDMNKFANECDVVFLALPHAIASKEVTKDILKKTKIIDLGADFRLKDVNTYESWYNVNHFGKDLLSKAVYGLCELNRDDIKNARLLANPGCYTTCSILSLVPLVAENIIDLDSIIIDAKSGVTGSGRGLNVGSLYCEVNESIHAYKVGGHRHTPEIEQELSRYVNKDIVLSFTPHLVPMNRGILTTIYANIKENITQSDIKDIYNKYYKDEHFIRLRDDLPKTSYVRGTNYFDTGFVLDKRMGRIVLVSAIDNLMKGASSQAVQNMNIMFGFEESLGIDFIPSYI